MNHDFGKFCSKCKNYKELELFRKCKYLSGKLMSHLESQFDTNMNWANYGIYWELDHIVPQSCLPYTSMTDTNFRKCWALKNLRPLEIRQNRIDGASKVRHKMFTNIFNGEI